jgi:hypothetical protein
MSTSARSGRLLLIDDEVELMTAPATGGVRRGGDEPGADGVGRRRGRGEEKEAHHQERAGHGRTSSVRVAVSESMLYPSRVAHRVSVFTFARTTQVPARVGRTVISPLRSESVAWRLAGLDREVRGVGRAGEPSLVRAIPIGSRAFCSVSRSAGCAGGAYGKGWCVGVA